VEEIAIKGLKGKKTIGALEAVLIIIITKTLVEYAQMNL
jgi:hypothetical protein